MNKSEAIDYIENLEVGSFLTLNIPILGDEKVSVTAMYMGKDKDNRYNFMEYGKFIFSKEFIERGTPSLETEYDGNQAMDINQKARKQDKKINRKKDRDLR